MKLNKKTVTFVAATGLLMAGPFSSLAWADDMDFGGDVDPNCTLTVGGTDGVLEPNPAGTVLGTKETGGSHGVVTAETNNASFSFSVTNPTAFTTAPATGGDNVTFVADYEGTGATTITAGTTIASTLALGTTTLDVELTATKSTGIFPAGAYDSTVVVTCS